MAKKILVVDDNPDIRTMLKTYLTSEGYQVLTAENGQKAIDAIVERIATYIASLAEAEMDERFPY